jgi:hypothetical protein
MARVVKPVNNDADVDPLQRNTHIDDYRAAAGNLTPTQLARRLHVSQTSQHAALVMDIIYVLVFFIIVFLYVFFIYFHPPLLRLVDGSHHRR